MERSEPQPRARPSPLVSAVPTPRAARSGRAAPSVGDSHSDIGAGGGEGAPTSSPLSERRGETDPARASEWIEPMAAARLNEPGSATMARRSVGSHIRRTRSGGEGGHARAQNPCPLRRSDTPRPADRSQPDQRHRGTDRHVGAGRGHASWLGRRGEGASIPLADVVDHGHGEIRIRSSTKTYDPTRTQPRDPSPRRRSRSCGEGSGGKGGSGPAPEPGSTASAKTMVVGVASVGCMGVLDEWSLSSRQTGLHTNS